MAAKDSLLDLERHAQLLEGTVAKLTQALERWQLLEAEYEALREDIVSVEKTPEAEQQTELVRIRRDFDGQLVDKQTVWELFGARTGQRVVRTPAHIINLVDRRLDYVRQNVATLRHQAEAAANRLAATQVISQPEMRDDDGAPITDIVEQLDDDDNVISFHLKTPANTEQHVREALQKAGISELPEGGPEEDKPEDKLEGKPAVTGGTAPKPKAARTPTPTATPRAANTAKQKKGVSFADDTKAGHSSPPEPRSHAAQRLDQIMRTAKDQESMVTESAAIIPPDESEEDAALRRDMLAYSMSEIGPIVAQLDLEEGGSSGDDDNYDDEYDDDYDEDDDDEEEDATGRSKYSIIDEAYRERMRELEKKLGVERPQDNAVPASITAPDVKLPLSSAEGGLGRIRVSGETDAPLPGSASLSEKKPKRNGEPKKVAFAETLDIASEEPMTPKAPAATKKAETPSVPLVDPLSDVIERTVHAKAPDSEPAAPGATKKRQSRFKMARGGSGPASAASAAPITPQLPKGPHDAPLRFLDQDRAAPPSGPEGKTVADAIVERQATTEPREPDELDASLLMQETAVAYHRTRNRLIQQQGGFLHAAESIEEIVPDDDEEPLRHVSKFKAARLSRQ